MLTLGRYWKKVYTLMTRTRPLVYGISCICHADAGIRYIGKTTNLHKRINAHRTSSKEGQTKLYRWMRRHDYTFSIVEDDVIESNLNDREIFLIAEYRKIGNLLNMTDGGDGQSPGWVPSNELRKQWSEQRIGPGNGRYGKSLTPEQKMNISVGIKNSPAFQGRLATARANRKPKPPPNPRVYLSSANNPTYGIARTVDVRKKISDSKMKLGPDARLELIVGFSELRSINKSDRAVAIILGRKYGISINSVLRYVGIVERERAFDE